MTSVTLRRWAVLGLLSLLALVARAETVGIVITATGLARADGTALPDNSLVQLIANTAGQTPGAPTVSSFATGSDVVLASFGLNSASTGVAGSFQIYLTVDRSAFPGLNPGAPLLLRWYDLAYAGGQTGPGTAVYGQFTTTAVVDGSTSGWTLDADGNNAALNFIDVSNGGSQPATAGKTSFSVAPPAVTSLSPTSGASTGATVVTITGNHFTGATAVQFGANAGTSLTVVNDTTITVTSPAGADGTVDVTVTTANGTSVTSASDQFSYVVAPSITTAPQTQAVAGQGSTTLSVVASGTGPFTYQWYFNGSALTGQTGATLTLSSAALANAGAYTVTVTNSAGSVTSDPATLSVGPYITALSTDSSVGLGGSQTFSVTAAGSGTLTYQWRKGTTPIAGATNATYVIDPVTVADAGSYNVVVGGSGLNATSGNSVLTVLPNPLVTTATTRIADANGVSAYLAIEGTAAKKVVIAAYGPALTSVAGAITDPQLEVFDAAATSVATNNDWGTISDGTFASTYARLGLTPLASGSKDAVIYATLPAGTYRVQVTGVAGATGAVRIAIADADLNPGSRIAYLAVRGPLSASSPLTAGISMVSPAAKNLLFRAIGPTLGAGGHADPVLTVYDTDATSVLFNNDNWGGGGTLGTAFGQAGAFALASDSKDSAVLGSMRFGTGAYTAQVTATSGAGDVLWELYDPNGNTSASFAPIIVVPPSGQTFGAASVTLSTVAVGGGTLAYQWKKSGVPIDGATNATYTVANPTASDAGTYTVQVTNTAGTASASAALRALPVISSAAATSATYGKAFTFAVTASAAPTSFGATNLPGGLSIDTATGVISGAPTSVGVTTATITATNADGTGSASLQITVGKRSISITADGGQTKVYGTTDPALTYSIGGDGLFGSDALTGALTRAGGESVGSYAIGQGTLAASGNYDLTFTGANFAITARPITVTADGGLTKVYGGTDPVAFTYQITSGSLVGGDTLSGALTRDAGENVASYAIKRGTLTAGGNYALTFTGANFAITPKPITLTANTGQSKTYGTSDPASFTYTVAPGALVGSETISGAATRAPGEAAGTYAINQGTLSAGPNYAITFVPANFTIAKATLTVTADNLSRAYGAANPTFTSVIAGFVGTDNLANSVTGAPALTTTATTSSAQGSYPITVALHTLAAANYSFTLVDGTLTVTKAELVVTADPQTKVYGAVNPAPTYTITGFLGSDTAAVVTGVPVLTHAATASSPVGTYGITVALGSLATNNYTFRLVDGQLTVTKATLTVTADTGQSKIYGTADATLTYTIGGSGLIGSDTLSGTLTRDAGENVGSYAIKQGTLTANANYTLNFTGANFALTARPITVTADGGLTKVYGGTDPVAFTYQITSGSLVGGDTLSGALTRDAGENVAGYAIKQGTLTAGGNYALTFTGANFAITPKPITLTANTGQSKTYGAADPSTFTYSVVPGALVGSDGISGAAVRAPGEAAGSYAISQGSLSAGPNYAITFVPANFTIAKATLTVTADNLSRAYGAANPTFTSVIAGFVGTDTLANSVTGAPDLTTTATTTSAQGSYPITVALHTLAAANYNFTLVDGTLTVTKAELVVTADPQTKVYGAVNPAPTYTITGFLGSDTAAVVTGVPVLTHAATSSSPVGTYGITVALGSLATNNYTFRLVDGQLTVTKATLTVTADPQSKVYGAPVPDASAFTATLSGFVNGETLATSGVTGSAAVTTTVTAASGVAGSPYVLTPAVGMLASANYDFAFAPGAYTVTPAPLTVTADPQTMVYGATVPTLTATLSGFVNGETLATSGVSGAPAVTSTATANSGAGTYAITPAVGTLTAANYAFAAFTPGTLTVTKAVLLVKADGKTMAYGAAVPAFTATITGFVNGDTTATAVSGSALLSSTGGTSSGVGSYPITAALGSLAAANYTFTFAPGTLAISAAPVAITLGNLSQVYDGRAKQASITLSPAGVAVSVAYSPGQPVDVGSYVVTVAANDPNYVGTASGTLVVTNASQSIAINAPTSAGIGIPVSVSASASSGLPVTLSASGPATLSGGQLTFTSPGTVTLTATQAGNKDFAAATATATVTVAGRLSQSIAFPGLNDRLSNSGAFALTATASSGLPVSFAIVSGPAMLSGNTVTLTGAAGQVVIRASQPGNTQYDPAPEVTASFTVTAATLNVYFGTVTSSGSTAKTGDVAATLPPDSRQGNLLVVAPDVGINTVLDFTLNADNTFTATITPSAQGTDTSLSGRQALTASSLTLTVHGSLVNGRLNGVIDPLGLTFSANVLPVNGPSANAAGFYSSSTLANTSGATYTVVGTNNQVLVLATTPDVTAGGMTTLNANGTFGLQTQTAAGAATIAGAVDTPTTTVAGTITVPGKPDTSFAGLVVTTTRTDRLINLSSRARVGSGDHVLVTGFVIGGSDPKPVLIRGVGPALAGFGVADTLAKPRIRIYRDGAMVAENSGWSTAANAGTLAAVTSRLGGFALQDNSADAALLTTLAPGAYTAEVTDASPGGAQGGVALAEIYDASTNPNADYQRLVNISTRGDAGTGDNVLVGGFIVRGNAPKKLLIRGIGPALAGFGVADALADPRLRIYQGATLIAENDNWSAASDSDVAALKVAMRDTGAFTLPVGSRDAAIILTLAPGSYTAQVGSSDGASTGVALVEIYEIPQ